VFWQIIDNLPFNIVWDEGFGLFRSRNGLFYLNLVGETFKRKLAGQTVAPLVGGPMLRRSPPGFVNAATGETDFQLNPNSRINVFANGEDTPFSATGNRITIEQMFNQFIISRDNAQDFTESATQISASLPAGLRPGLAFAQVLDASGVESQGQFIHFNCAACPAIGEIIDSERQLGEFHPGTVVTITGSGFSPSGNTVIVEQEDLTGRKYRFVVPGADVSQESPELIKVRLPRDLIITKFTVVVVANRDGLESNIYPLRAFPHAGITAECPSCAPAISVKRGVVNQSDGSENILPGAVVTISGDGFSTSMNAVIVEQGNERYLVAKDGAWVESQTRINAKLPASLQAGRALLYVVNAQGRESKALAITIARGVPGGRQPIRRGRPRGIQ
ncbi:MAG: hypothetical protein ACRD9Y_17900, partial [Blastocatellia bacterium]